MWCLDEEINSSMICYCCSTGIHCVLCVGGSRAIRLCSRVRYVGSCIYTYCQLLQNCKPATLFTAHRWDIIQLHYNFIIVQWPQSIIDHVLYFTYTQLYNIFVLHKSYEVAIGLVTGGDSHSYSPALYHIILTSLIWISIQGQCPGQQLGLGSD